LPEASSKAFRVDGGIALLDRTFANVGHLGLSEKSCSSSGDDSGAEIMAALIAVPSRD
jgi:hypothetical protein